jgi:tetratricopeptide (TPR) repeat protein
MHDGLKRVPPVVLLVVFAMLASGCFSKRVVYIPSDWHAAPPPAATTSKVTSVSPPPASPAQPMLPTPRIEERDLKALPEKSPSAAVAPSEAAAPEVPKPAHEGIPATPASPGTPIPPATPGTPATPQYLASMHLVNTAKTALKQGKPDQAIAQLEQAIQVDAYNAEAFYVLAQAWQTKGDMKRALEFARKAEILYQDEPPALKKVYLLEADLLKRTGQASEAAIYRQKATRLGM